MVIEARFGKLETIENISVFLCGNRFPTGSDRDIVRKEAGSFRRRQSFEAVMCVKRQ